MNVFEVNFGWGCMITNWDDLDEIIADWDNIIRMTPCQWDEIIPTDEGWLPQWDEARMHSDMFEY